MDKLFAIKKWLYQQCKLIVGQKISTIKSALNEAQKGANNETKSSAGDKHETGRAMAQLETEKLSGQLAQALKLAHTLNQINSETINKQINLGSLVLTSNGNFYISVSLGSIALDEKVYYAISPVSPIGKQLMGLKEGDCFTLNGKTYQILDLA